MGMYLPGQDGGQDGEAPTVLLAELEGLKVQLLEKLALQQPHGQHGNFTGGGGDGLGADDDTLYDGTDGLYSDPS